MAEGKPEIETANGSGCHPGAIHVSYELPDGQRKTERYTASFIVGRDESCQVRLTNELVSNRHLALYPTATGWWIRDLGSTNGTYLNGERVQNSPVTNKATVQIGSDGPVIELQMEVYSTTISTPPARMTMPELVSVTDTVSESNRLKDPTPVEDKAESVTQIIEKYTEEAPSKEDTTHTQMMRQAFERVKTTQSKRYRIVIGVVVLVLVVFIGIVVYQHLRLKKITEMGVEIFYNMKTLEVQIEQIVDAMEKSGGTARQLEIRDKRKQLQAMRERYDDFVEESGLLGEHLSQEDQIIYRLARLFGECELNVPEDFLDEVKRYIQKWKSTTRLQRAMNRVTENQYAQKVYHNMIQNHLPPQFLYLALQESDFRKHAVGPKTRLGIAKGFWQFMPETALQYGLHTGPLIELPKYDPLDERFDFDKSTRAASKYLRYIYNTEAQASGLLVMASYNWGHNAIRRRIKKMPHNPRERNFWRLLENQRIPKETYDYVFYIFSAAVIGENPQLFGFEFENPLKDIEEAS